MQHTVKETSDAKCHMFSEHISQLTLENIDMWMEWLDDHNISFGDPQDLGRDAGYIESTDKTIGIFTPKTSSNLFWTIVMMSPTRDNLAMLFKLEFI